MRVWRNMASIAWLTRSFETDSRSEWIDADPIPEAKENTPGRPFAFCTIEAKAPNAAYRGGQPIHRGLADRNHRPSIGSVRILIIGINYRPEKTGIGPYTAELAAYLAGRGHEVAVITGLPSYPEWRVQSAYQRTLWKNEWEDGVRVHRRWHYVPRTQSALRRFAYEITFLLTGGSALLLPKPDLVIGIVPTLSGGVVARIAAIRFGVPYALIFQDLVGLAASQTGISGAQAVASLVTRLERWTCQRAKAIAIIADGFRAYLEDLGVSGHRIHRVRNWCRLRPPTAEREATRLRLGWSCDAIVCLHSGNMGYKQGLENILDCARLAAADKALERLRFVLMGDGNQRAELEQLAADISNVSFLPLQSDEELPNVLAAADILLLNQRAGVSEMALPSKLTSYLAAGRPVVAAVEQNSETAKELGAAEAGVITGPDDPTALLAAISRLAQDPVTQRCLGIKGRKYAMRVLSAGAALSTVEELLIETVPGPTAQQSRRRIEAAD